MFQTIQKLHRSVVQTHRIAEPASTLLLVSIVAVLLGLVTRITFAQPNTDTVNAIVSEQTAPGSTVTVQVPGLPGQTLAAYLPGLTSEPVPLDYDDDARIYRASVTVPATAPSQGYCTVRIVGDSSHELDRHVRLIESIVGPGS